MTLRIVRSSAGSNRSNRLTPPSAPARRLCRDARRVRICHLERQREILHSQHHMKKDFSPLARNDNYALTRSRIRREQRLDDLNELNG